PPLLPTSPESLGLSVKAPPGAIAGNGRAEGGALSFGRRGSQSAPVAASAQASGQVVVRGSEPAQDRAQANGDRGPPRRSFETREKDTFPWGAPRAEPPVPVQYRLCRRSECARRRRAKSPAAFRKIRARKRGEWAILATRSLLVRGGDGRPRSCC